MIDLFEFPAGDTRDPSAHPKTGDVGLVRGYRPHHQNGNEQYLSS